MENKISFLKRDEPLKYGLYVGNFFSKIFCPYYQKSIEFLSSLVFHTVTLQVIPHYYKQSLLEYVVEKKSFLYKDEI